MTEHREAVLCRVRAALGLNRDDDTPRGCLSPRPAGPAPSDERPTPVVFSPRLPGTVRAGWPDLLVWAGDGYQPVIIRAHRTLDPGQGAQCSPVGDLSRVQPDPGRRVHRNRADLIALAHHYRQLTDLGWASGVARGGVIGRGSAAAGVDVAAGPGDGSRDVAAGRGDGGDAAVVVWYDLDVPGASVLADYDRRFADRLAVAGAAASGAEPLAWPSRIAECRRCPWWPRCSAELEDARDVSLLVTGGDVAVLQAAGVRTVDELADLPRESVTALPLTAAPAAQSRVRARAWQRGIPLVRIGRRGAIRRTDVELDVDSESYGQDGAYLWGTYLSGADVGLDAGYRPFVTWQPLPSVSEARVFVDFYRFLRQVRSAAAARGLGFAAFCYAREAEERWMRAIPRRHPEVAGMPTAAEVSGFCRSPQWVDEHAELKRLFLPTGSLRLKVVATKLGFSWRDPEPGGENSLAWYRAAVGAGSAARDPAMAERILRYNEDDVRATLRVREWLSQHGTTLPTVAELEAADAASTLDVESEAGATVPGMAAAPGASAGTGRPVTAAASAAHRPAG